MTCSPRESATQTEIRLAAHDLGLILWRNNVGMRQIGNRTIQYGLGKGSPDLVGLLVPEGTFAAIETKSATGRLTPEQRLFLDLVRRSGGVAIEARSVDDVRAALAAFRTR